MQKMGQKAESLQEISEQSAKPRLRDQLHSAISVRFYSRRTEQTYWYWIRYFIRFHGKRHPAEMGAVEVTAFLNWLATERNVAAATQNQALNALLFLYKHVLGRELPWFDGLVRAKRPVRLPVVLSESEVKRLLAQLEGFKWMMASRLYGAGLRLHECLMLRVKDVDFAYRQIVVRDCKGEGSRHRAAGECGAAASGSSRQGSRLAPAGSGRRLRRGVAAPRALAEISTRRL